MLLISIMFPTSQIVVKQPKISRKSIGKKVLQSICAYQSKMNNTGTFANLLPLFERCKDFNSMNDS